MRKPRWGLVSPLNLQLGVNSIEQFKTVIVSQQLPK